MGFQPLQYRAADISCLASDPAFCFAYSFIHRLHVLRLGMGGRCKEEWDDCYMHGMSVLSFIHLILAFLWYCDLIELLKEI
jgi:hypothetical protein